ncbi:MAG: short-chain dehydrogenase [Phycisphaerae bacterium]|nr:short-chain dehydrogenase [Phycisphaerae bacterium]
MSSPVALVTGASSGIGRAVASMLSAEGYDLVLCARREDALEALASELREQHETDVMVRPVDLVDLNDVSAIVPELLEHFGRLDVLINNAGMVEKSSLQEMPMGFMQRAMAVHAIAPAILVRDAWAALAEADRGVVVHVSTVSTLSPFPGLAAYAMSKHALEGLARSIQAESEEQGLGIVSLVIAPGAVDTDALRSVLEGIEPPAEALVPMDEITSLFLACIGGKHDQEAGGVIYIPAPGVVTADAERAMEALEACWGGPGEG